MLCHQPRVAPGAVEFHLHRILDSFQLEKPSKTILSDLGQCSELLCCGALTALLQHSQTLSMARGARADVTVPAGAGGGDSQQCCSELKAGGK